MEFVLFRRKVTLFPFEELFIYRVKKKLCCPLSTFCTFPSLRKRNPGYTDVNLFWIRQRNWIAYEVLRIGVA